MHMYMYMHTCTCMYTSLLSGVLGMFSLLASVGEPDLSSGLEVSFALRAPPAIPDVFLTLTEPALRAGLEAKSSIS